MPEHYGNQRNNNTLENTTENLKNRPRHVGLTMIFLLSNNCLSEHIAQSKIGLIGQSMVGYTALALAGGVHRTKEVVVVEVMPDLRIKAIVLFAPGTGWFIKLLEKVTIPLLMITAEHDPITSKWNAEIVFIMFLTSPKLYLKKLKMQDTIHF